jgi:hypothetical protein
VGDIGGGHDRIAHYRLLGGQTVERADDARMEDILRVLKQVKETRPSPDVLASIRTFENGQCLRAVGRLELIKFTGYLPDGLLPANLLPPTFTAFTRSFQGMKELVRVIKPLDGVAWSFTTEPAAQPVIGVGLNLNDLAVLYMDQHATTDGAKATARFFNDPFGHGHLSIITP